MYCLQFTFNLSLIIKKNLHIKVMDNTFNFEQSFYTNIINNHKDIKNKYLDTYLQTTRHNILLYNNLNDEYQLLCNNYIIKDNKHYFKIIDENRKEYLKHEIKTLILKQRELHYHFAHHSKLYIIPDFIKKQNNEIKESDKISIHEKRTSSIKEINNTSMNEKRKSSIKEIDNTSTNEKRKSSIKEIDKNQFIPEKVKVSEIRNMFENKLDNSDTKSIRSTRSIRSTTSIKSTISSKSTTSNESKKSYKVIRNNEDVSNKDATSRIKLPKFFTKKT